MTSDAMWDEDGAVAYAARACGGSYHPRREQIEIATRITKALERYDPHSSQILLIEAGTGVGKTLAYLIPGALDIVSNGGRMLIGTHTIALMRQIMLRDGPIAMAAVGRALGRHPTIAQLRGRKNFASPARCRAFAENLRADGLKISEWGRYEDLAARTERCLEDARRLKDFDTPEAIDAASKVIAEALVDSFEAETGFEIDRSQIRLLASAPEDERLIHELSREVAEKADILLTTHASIAVQLAMKTLPGASRNDPEPYRFLVLDEAHHWATAAASASLVSLSLDSVAHALASIESLPGDTNTSRAVRALASSAASMLDELRSEAPMVANASFKLAENNRTLDILQDLQGKLEDLTKVAARAPDQYAAASGKLDDLSDEIARLFRATGSNSSLWEPRWTTSRVNAAPSLTVKSKAPGRLLKRVWQSGDARSPLANTVLLTSATLSTPGYGQTSQWADIEISTGISRKQDNFVHSDLCAVIHPEDFGHLNVRFAHPEAPIPHPQTDGKWDRDALHYAVGVVSEARRNKGRCLVLVPAYTDVEEFAANLPGVLAHRHGMPLSGFLESFKAASDSCLITPAMWDGHDLPGLIDNLVIPRLPFPPSDSTDDKIIPTLSKMLSKLAQGIGRTIRRPQDSATLWFSDPRMPPPEVLSERTLLMPNPASQGLYLAAIPLRFRRKFDLEETAASFVSTRIPDPSSPRRKASAA